MEINVKVTLENLKATVKMTEEKDKNGDVVDRRLVTQATIEYEGTPAKLDKVLWALQAGQNVEVTFTCPQSAFDILAQGKEPALAGASK